MRALVLAICFLLPAIDGYGFEVDGVRTGMSVDKVREIYPQIERIDIGSSGLDNYWIFRVGEGVDRIFGFCGGALVHYWKRVAGDEKTFIGMVEKETLRRGRSGSYKAEEANTSEGTIYVLQFDWEVGSDLYTVSFTSSENHEQSIAQWWTTPNRCE